jgi:hypothetical protein
MSDERRDLDADFADEEDRVSASIPMRIQRLSLKSGVRPCSGNCRAQEAVSFDRFRVAAGQPSLYQLRHSARWAHTTFTSSILSPRNCKRRLKELLREPERL